MNFDEKIYASIYSLCADDFNELYQRLEDGMRARGHPPDLIHRLLQEDDYVWRNAAKELVVRINEVVQEMEMEFQVITNEMLVQHIIKALKELYEDYTARMRN